MSFFDCKTFETMAYGSCFDLYIERKWNLEKRVDAGIFAMNAMDWTSETLEVPEKTFGALLSSQFCNEDDDMGVTSSLQEERSAAIHAMVMGDMAHEELVFVLIDSNAFHCKTIEQYLNELRSEYYAGTKFVVVKSNTSFIENNHKIIHSDKYENIDFMTLTNNLATLGELAFSNVRSLPLFETLAIPAEFEFQLYHSELEQHFANNDRMNVADQRQMNDNVQIELMCAIADTVPGSRVVMITEDKLMIELLKRKRWEQELSIDIRDVVGNYV
jgi:hypothetical protein